MKSLFCSTLFFLFVNVLISQELQLEISPWKPLKEFGKKVELFFHGDESVVSYFFIDDKMLALDLTRSELKVITWNPSKDSIVYFIFQDTLVLKKGSKKGFTFSSLEGNYINFSKIKLYSDSISCKIPKSILPAYTLTKKSIFSKKYLYFTAPEKPLSTCRVRLKSYLVGKKKIKGKASIYEEINNKILLIKGTCVFDFDPFKIWWVKPKHKVLFSY